MKDFKKQLQKLAKDGKIYGMRFNAYKTNTMVFGKQRIQQVGSSTKPKPNNITTEEVSNFVYLGSKLTWENDSMAIYSEECSW